MRRTDAAGSSQNEHPTLAVHSLKEQILTRIIADLYDQRIMSNLVRPQYVERMIAIALGENWKLVSADWAGWDLESSGGVRLEIKQSAARQTWSHRPSLGGRPTLGIFDIAPRKGYFTKGGLEWVEAPGRHADIYVFAWHPIYDPCEADHRDPCQWEVFVVPENELPQQKTLSKSSLSRQYSPVTISDLAATIGAAIETLPQLKAARTVATRS